MPNDPLLQPYDLKHLRLRNRIMITSHEPAYTEDGRPKEWCRACNAERAKAGVALTIPDVATRDDAGALDETCIAERTAARGFVPVDQRHH